MPPRKKASRAIGPSTLGDTERKRVAPHRGKTETAHMQRLPNARLTVLAVLMITVTCLVTVFQVGSDFASGRVYKADSFSRGGGVHKFPLWVAVPSRAFAVLGEGVVRETQWGAYVFRGNGPKAGRTPCLVAALFHHGGANRRSGLFVPGIPQCGPLAPPAQEVAMANVGITIKKSLTGPTIVAKAVAMSFSPNVRMVRLQLMPGQSQTRRTRLLSTEQAEKAHVRPFRYVAFSIARDACIASVTGTDAVGAEIMHSSIKSC